MKKLFLVIAGFLLLWATGAQAASISFNPLSSTIVDGSTFTVDIIGQDFPTTEGGGAEVFYNPSIVNILGVTIDGTVWEFDSDTGSIDNTVGSLTALWVATWDGAGPDFTVATIEFLAVGPGTTDLMVTEYAGNTWASSLVEGYDVNPTMTTGSIEVTAVPEPTSLLLIGTGFAGLWGVSRRKN